MMSLRTDTGPESIPLLYSPTVIHCGVSQGSVLGPILFILYTQPLSCVIGNYPVMIPTYTVLVVHQRSVLPSTTWRNAYVMSNLG